MFIYDELLLRRRNKVYIQPKDAEYVQNKRDINVLTTGMSNLLRMGYVLSPAAMQRLLHMDHEELEHCFNTWSEVLSARVGGDHTYAPMYPNFPKQVAESSYVELFFNAFFHYMTYGYFKPDYVKEARLPLEDIDKKQVLTLGDMPDVYDVFVNLLSSTTSWSQVDKKDVACIINSETKYAAYLPEEIPFKENAAFVCATIMMQTSPSEWGLSAKYVHTATDVLRVVTARMGGDVSLALNCKYQFATRAERRFVMDLLAGCGDITEDLFRHEKKWLRLGEALHPFTYKQAKYSAVVQAFNVLRNGPKPLFFNGRVEKALAQKDLDALLSSLTKRPGELARRLDVLLRGYPQDAERILDAFAAVANQVSAPLLLSVKAHFAHRDQQKTVNRGYFPKMYGVLRIIDAVDADLDADICQRVVAVCDGALKEIFAAREQMGKVYVDPRLKGFIVPFSQRTASDTSLSLTRGSRFDLEGNVMRGFIWWTNMRNHFRVDIDLSATVFDENWQYVEHVSYTRLKSNTFGMYHSGDIVDGGPWYGDGVAEFLDVDLDKVLAQKGRYVVFQVYNYTDYSYDMMDHCAFGWMQRSKPNSGEIFEPSTVKMKMSVSAHACDAVPVIFDCLTKQAIWCDFALDREAEMLHNVEEQSGRVAQCCQYMVNIPKVNLYELVCLHAEAHGQLVDTPEEADIVFGLEPNAMETTDTLRYVSAFDTDYIMGQLL